MRNLLIPLLLLAAPATASIATIGYGTPAWSPFDKHDTTLVTDQEVPATMSGPQLDAELPVDPEVEAEAGRTFLEFAEGMFTAPVPTLLTSSVGEIIGLLAALMLTAKGVWTYGPIGAGFLVGEGVRGGAGRIKAFLWAALGAANPFLKNWPKPGQLYVWPDRLPNGDNDERLVIERSFRKGIVTWVRPDAESEKPGESNIHQWRHKNPAKQA